jgi:hypothetical protein
MTYSIWQRNLFVWFSHWRNRGSPYIRAYTVNKQPRTAGTSPVMQAQLRPSNQHIQTNCWINIPIIISHYISAAIYSWHVCAELNSEYVCPTCIQLRRVAGIRAPLVKAAVALLKLKLNHGTASRTRDVWDLTYTAAGSWTLLFLPTRGVKNQFL